MYSGLLPKGLTEDDLSPDDEEDEQEDDVEEKGREGEKCWVSAAKLSSAGENTGSVVEAQSTHDASDSDSNSPTCSMPGISQEMWQVCWYGMQLAAHSIHCETQTSCRVSLVLLSGVQASS